MKRKTILIAALLALISIPVRAQIPVTDILATVQHVLEVAVRETTNAVLKLQAESLFIMDRRLASWSSTLKFFIPQDDTPEWRIFDWFSEDPNVAFVKELHRVLSYGTDAAGVAYADITTPHLTPVLIGEEGLPEGLRTQLATVEMSDAVVIRAMNDLGTLRYAGREQQAQVEALEKMVLDETDTQGANAVAGKLTAQTLIEARDQQSQITRNTALVELLTVQAKRDRDQAADQINGRLNQLQDGGDQWRQTVTGSGAVLNRWYP